jgi:hypothetical protein
MKTPRERGGTRGEDWTRGLLNPKQAEAEASPYTLRSSLSYFLLESLRRLSMKDIFSFMISAMY